MNLSHRTSQAEARWRAAPVNPTQGEDMPYSEDHIAAMLKRSNDPSTLRKPSTATLLKLKVMNVLDERERTSHEIFRLLDAEHSGGQQQSIREALRGLVRWGMVERSTAARQHGLATWRRL